MIVSTMLTVMTVPYDAVLNAHENMLYYAIVGIIESVLKLAVALIVVYTFADKLVIYGALMAGISLLVMIIMRVYCHRKYVECEFKPKTYYDKALMKEMTGFAGWNFLTASFSIINNYGLGIILNIFFGTILNAAQGIANQANGLLLTFSTNLMKALSPVIIKNEGAGNRKKMIYSSIMGCKFSFFINSMFMAPFILFTPFILKIWINNVPEYTIIFVQLLLLQTLLECFLNSLNQMISAQGNIKNISIIRAIHNIIYLPLIVVFFYWNFLPYTMYIIMIVKTVFSIAICLYFSKINCELNIKYFIKDVISKSITFFVILYCLLNIIGKTVTQNIINQLLIVYFLSIILSIVLFNFILLNKMERIWLKNHLIEIIKRKKRK
jgi:Na+-driven multidrug efflux pump